MRILNGIYRAKINHGKNDRKYRNNDEVKFIKYLGKSRWGSCRIKYELLNFKGEVLGTSNKFRTCDIDWDTRYIIKNA